MQRAVLRRGLLVAVAIALVAWFTAPRAFASPAHHAGRIVLSLPGGGPGPLQLYPSQGGWMGAFTITNLGAEPLTVSRIVVRGDEDDVRSPSRLSVRFADGTATSATIPAGADREVVVSWMPDREPRVRQAFGHVIVTSTDEEAGEVAMGFRAQRPTGLGWIGAHALALLVLLPLTVLLVAVVSRMAGRRDDSIVRCAAIGAAVLELALALAVYQRFTPDVGRADGNEGFQFVERATWVRSIGSEWYVGVDGTSIALVLLAATLGLVAVVASRGPERRSDAYYAALGLLASGVMGVLVSLDLVLLFAAWQLVLVSLAMLIGGWGGPRGEHAAAKLAIYGVIGSAAMLAAFVALSRASERTFLVDGAAVAHTLSIPELARTSFTAKGPILGVPFVEGVWVLLFVAASVVTPIVPMHGWLPDALEEAPAGVAVILGGVVLALGPYLLVRVGFGAMPEGARWAGASIAALGALGVAYGAFCAMAQRDLRRFVAYASIASAGACVFGVGAFTSQGIAGSIATMFAHGLAAAMLLGAASAIEQRLGSCDMTRLGGLASEAPALGAIVGVGLGVSLGVPGLVGFWGPLLALLGGFARHPVLAVLLAAALIPLTAAHLRVARLVLLGSVDPAWRKSTHLEPFGGRIPDARPRELAALVPLAALAFLLGVWPVPLLSQIAAGVRDASTMVDPSNPDTIVDPR